MKISSSKNVMPMEGITQRQMILERYKKCDAIIMGTHCECISMCKLRAHPQLEIVCMILQLYLIASFGYI